MSSRKDIQSDPRKALGDEMADVRAGMLGVEGSGQHMQPMTHFPDWHNNTLWFITTKDSDLVRSIGTGGKAHYCVIGEDHDFHACLSGLIEVTMDRAKLDELWSPVVGAWFDGKDDPKLTMLRMRLHDAALWGSTDSTLRFGFEIARANLVEGHEPDIGAHTVIRFAA